jgi:hypothetical protein
MYPFFQFMKRITIILVTVLISFIAFDQIDYSIAIPWSGEKTKASMYGEEIDVPAFPYSYSDKNAYCFVSKLLQKGATLSKWTYQVKNIETAPASAFDVQFILSQQNVGTVPQITFNVCRDRQFEYFTFECVPYIMQNGVLQRITNINLSIVNLGNIASKPVAKSYVANSALQNGNWYQIKISNSGVYKVDKDFLENMGIQTNNLSSNSINVYGNGMGMLSIQNSDFHPDDIVKNPIKMNDGGDGLFNSSQDYFLFYANGPDEKKYVPGTGMTIIKNIYVDKSIYFIHIDPSDAPARISNGGLSANPSTISVSTSDNVISHEEDLANFAKSGQNWYGELFDNTLYYTFPFSLGDLNTASPVSIFCSFANAGSGAGSHFNLYLNSSMVQSATLFNMNDYDVAHRQSMIINQNLSSSTFSIGVELARVNPSVQARLDKLEIRYVNNLSYNNAQFDFRNIASIGSGNVAEFNVVNALGTNIWEITNPRNVSNVNYTGLGFSAVFKVDMDSLRQFIVFKDADAFIPQAGTQIVNQNLHALSFADFLIVTHPDFVEQANRLANLHRNKGLSVNVVTTTQVYNEFSSGMLDPYAIRRFAKMFYDKAAGDPTKMPKYLCLFGDGTYDPKNRLSGNNYKVPTYQSVNSENLIASIVSDDFYAFLDDSESFLPSNLLDIGVGRIIATTQQQAVDMVNKIEHYMHNGSNLYPNQGGVEVDENGYSSTFGDWRLWITQIADDEELSYFINDQELVYANYSVNHPEYNGNKIYLDAYTQISVVGGQRYPDVVTAIDNQIDKGSLIMMYVGHGGETGLALERVVSIPQILAWKNINKLTLFVSATCEFTRYDDPSRESAGEEMYLSDHGGSIAMLTTTRPVTFYTNSSVNYHLFDYILARDNTGTPLGLGEIIRKTKNASTTQNDKMVFTLIGDPALQLKLQPLRVVVDSVNGFSPASVVDTLMSLSKVNIKCHIEDTLGNIMNGFNGIAYPSVFDKPKTYATLGQDPSSTIENFVMQKNYLYRGKSTVKNGYFQFSFIVPKDINYDYGNGKISLYANSTTTDANGKDTRIIVGGIDPNGIVDNTGPELRLYMNDESFVNQGITDENPIFLAKLFDENGINTVGNGIGHDITAILDANSANPIVLNQFYISDLDTYQSGKVRYPMYNIAEGKHVITMKVWDVNNNSASSTIEFTVVKNKEVSIDHVLNYPNPFTTHTEFFFEHNQINANLEVQIQIMTITGKLVRTINQSVRTAGYRSEGIPWDGRDDFGDQLAKGVYVYKLSVKAPDGSTANKIEKLVLLK